MDSKLKGQVIFCSVSIIILVIAIVVLMNRMQNDKRAGFKGDMQTQNDIQIANTQNVNGVSTDPIVTQYQLNPEKDPKAFLRDPGFFDPVEEEKDPASILSLLVSSVQNDLRVIVVDGNGNTVQGQKFEIQVMGTGEAENPVISDDDQDGILYIPQIDAGDYQVALKETSGFEVPKESVNVSVQNEISYTVLSDISYLLKTEDQIDASQEDTAVKEADVDADGTENNKRLEDGASVFGIDVSKWNKDIDWKKVKASGVEFAIIRCGYRGSKTGYLVEDPYFEKNIKEASEAGIRIGVYFFTQATNDVEAVEEASTVLTLCKDYPIAFPIFIDTEGAGGSGRADGLDKETRTRVCKVFCETIENAGFNAGVYASTNWFIHNLDSKQLSGYNTWLAQYSKKPTYDGEYAMWQYTSAGSIDGINGLVDFNASYMDY